ncbi:hypothetical protein GCM10010329_28880 [Streptomyces spiroverticillatus]|uniref:Uncharacterized protein n=1 Tax=Streptomyces finlayi TaxID=67296 RepID=A0A918WVX7_9ACTN|nr:hypothetical protein GCM10010329_28880 [Streptomyces spiroverticillatus]GHC88525.1 hypothetical protein GCM10010334_21290 [Streptomyces finlayi]
MSVTKQDIGKRVEDDRGRVGVLKEVMQDWADPSDLPWKRTVRPTAFVRDEKTGLEWILPARTVFKI